MADTTKGTHEQGTTGGNPGTTAGQSGYSAGTTGTTGSHASGQTGSQTGGHTGGQSGQGMTGSATQRAQSSGASQGGGQGSAQQMIDQARQTVTGAYDRTTETLNQTYRQAMNYGRENPGTMTLIAFGAGVAVGLLIAGSVTGSRSRTQRILPPVMNAISEIASEFLR